MIDSVLYEGYHTSSWKSSHREEELFQTPTEKDQAELDRIKKQCHAYSAINQLDLSQIKKNLCKPHNLGGRGWNEKKANMVERHYKSFLRHCVNERGLSPDQEVDEMWHTHILDTHKYADDCQEIFGYFLHHTPNYDHDPKGKWCQEGGGGGNCHPCKG